MGCSGLRITAVVFGCLGVVLLLSALASTSWMKGCISFGNIYKALGNLMKAKGQTVPQDTFEQAISLTKGMDMCIHLGLFKVQMNAGKLYDIGLNIEAGSMSGFMYLVIGGLIVAFLTSVPAVIILMVATRKHYEMDKEKARNTNRIALLLLTIAGCAALSGMATYSANTASCIHNPIKFMAEFGKSIMSSFSQILEGQSGMSGGLPSTGRRKRDVDLSGLEGLDSDMQEYMSTMLDGMDPIYGYSFILGWLSFVALLIAFVITGILYRRSNHSQYGDATMMI